VAIVGGGPAGIAAAIQLTRYSIPLIIFEKERLGGLLHNADLVENYPGFPKGIPGPELVKLFLSQFREGGVDPILEEVVGIETSADGFHLRTTGGGFFARCVVIASGTRPKPWDGPPIPPELMERVQSEVYPLRHLRNKHIVVIGAGDAAFDYALNLARANDVTILNRGSSVSCLPALERRASGEPRISYHAETSPTQITPTEGERLLVQCTARNGVGTFEADHLLLAIGREPDLDFIAPEVLENNDRLYPIGDVVNGSFRQTAIAVGDGIRTAMRIALKMNGERA
jgi:thioredoxin reductase